MEKNLKQSILYLKKERPEITEAASKILFTGLEIQRSFLPDWKLFFKRVNPS